MSCPPVPEAVAQRAAALAELHPALWRADRLGRLPAAAAAVPTGFAGLDAELPGGGWPCRMLTDLLLPHPGCGEIRLLAPALAQAAAADRPVMLFDPPALPCAPALARLGVPAQRLVVVHGGGDPHAARARPAGSELLWALEQVLKSGQAAAVLVWPPPALRADALRRLQLAAQRHAGLVFVLRGLAQAGQPSPAPLRLALRAAGPDRLAVRVLKRRGPPQAQPLRLQLPPVLPPQPDPSAAAASLAAAACARARAGAAGGSGRGAEGGQAAVASPPRPPQRGGGAALRPL